MKKKAVAGTIATAPFKYLLASGITDPVEDKKARNQELVKRLLANARDVEVKIAPRGTAFDHHNPMFGGSVTAVHGSDAAILAHELGHHDLSKDRIGRLVQNPATTIAGNASALATAALGLMRPRKGLTAARVITAAAAVPQVAYEGAASYKGLNRLREAGATEEELSAARNKLLRTWGTYALKLPENALNAFGPDLLKKLVT